MKFNPNKMSKIPKIPVLDKKKNNKHTYSNCYSLTIRTGNGFNLGSKSVKDIIEFIRSISLYHVLNVEMDSLDEHLQGGFYSETDLRQDTIRDKLNKFTINLFKDNAEYHDQLITTKQLEQVSKHACCLKSHNNFDVLVNYCMKNPTKRLSSFLTKDQNEKFYCSTHGNFRCYKCNPDNLNL